MTSTGNAQLINQFLAENSPATTEEPTVLRLEKIRKSKKPAPFTYFYKVKNHHELFRVGQSYLNDYNNGVRSFAISSLGYQASQQRTILGLASFFDHQDSLKENLKIGIISDNLFLGPFKTIVQSSSAKGMMLNTSTASKVQILVHSFYGHFDFVDLNELIGFANMPDSTFDELIKEFLGQFDLVFWDVPELHKIQTERSSYYPMIMCFDSLTIIVAQGQTRREEVDRIRTFFGGYGINLKGLILDEPGNPRANNPETKRPWWKRWFN